ncbi:MAG: GTPase Era [Chloroflexota bacterium]
MNDYEIDPDLGQEFASPDETYETPPDHRSGFVALVGRPNVGKSTLMNALMRQRIAAVSARPQTTRTRQLGIITAPDYQIVFQDTPGIIQQPRHKLDEFMLATALETLEDADIVLWLVDLSENPGRIERDIAGKLAELPESTRVLIALNKVDLVDTADVLSQTEGYTSLLPRAEWLHLSALTNEGIDLLLQKLVDNLPEGPRYYPVEQTTDVFMRDIAAEFIRAQIMAHMEDEIPYGTAVVVREFKERPNGVTYIGADVYVERANHKSMVIGSGGSQLKQIGAAARKDLEELVGGKVYLDLWVKVEPNWRRNEHLLKQFGYQQPTEK